MIEEHDVVAVIEDVPAERLRRGDVGAVVHCYPKDQAYEVEFVDEHGRTRGVVTLVAAQLMRLNLLSLSA